MIPHRIKLAGFLSYKDEQEIDFDGSALWMLAGRNGSGKSTIFDGVTYALFGYHRGGSQQVQELINKDSNSFAIEFDFSIDQQLYRIRRTAKRTARGSPGSTQQIYRKDIDWVPIADTNRKAEFDAWIREKLGLQYETFTSSVLLLQNRAEKLLDATPKGRAEVLASIVDLERYQRLHEKADTQRKNLKGRADQIKDQLEVIPEATDDQFRDSEFRLLLADGERESAKETVEKSQQLEYQARQWEEMQVRIGRLRDQWERANALLGDASKIETGYQRLRELQEVLPQINAIQQLRSDIQTSETRTNQLLAERDSVQARREDKHNAAELARKKRKTLQDSQTTDEQRRQQVEVRLRDLTAVLERLRLFEEEQTRLADTENRLQKLPANPRQAVTEAQALHDACLDKAAVFPILERFGASRNELGQHQRQLAEARRRELDLRKQGEEAKQRLQQVKTDHATALTDREAADARATELHTLMQQAKTELKDFQKLEGKKVCRHCGQALTAGHFKEEKVKRDREFKAAEAAHREAAKAQTDAKAEEARRLAIVQTAETELNSLRDAYRDTSKEIEQTARDADRCTTECRKSYDALQRPYQKRIAPALPEDWLATKYPEAADLKALKREVAEADTLRKQLRDAEETCRNWERLHQQADLSRQTIARLRQDLPSGDPAAIRGDHANLGAEETALKNRLAGVKKSLTDNQNEIDRLLREIEQIDKQLADVNGKLRAEEVNRRNGMDAIERARRTLPEAWQTLARDSGMKEQHQWNVELRDLEEKNTAQRYEQLAQARVGLGGFKHELAQAETQANEFPEEARLPVAEAKRRLQDAKLVEIEKEKLLRQAQQDKAILDQQREQRAKLQTEELAVGRELNYAELLAKLLGRDRLQRHLVRVAERQIVDYANAVLDRLSGGQLRLRLCGTEEGTAADRALELEAYNRITGDAPINVAFLSGSQRFRVAVSLALGIGQYASKSHRPIESVIIDEGFGCLDREGRQVMIQELQNLRGQLRCILLVSHQEEFADAFPDGYRFELQDGATRVTRFQR